MLLLVISLFSPPAGGIRHPFMAMLRFDIITLFPKMFDSPFAESIISRAQKEGKIEIVTHQLRDWATDKHHTTDDTPYGGGPGMVIKVTVVDEALRHVILSDHELCEDESKDPNIKGASFYGADSKKTRIVMLSASGQKFTQAKAIELSKYDNIVLLCGHYEGFDYRVHEHLVDEEISIGDYVLTGGEIPALVVIDAVTRMIPGVIKEESIMSESFMPAAKKQLPTNLQIKRKYENTNTKAQSGCHCEESADLAETKQSSISPIDQLTDQPINQSTNFDYPVYTRPVEYGGWRVPEVLQNGNHAEIDKWRNRKAGSSSRWLPAGPSIWIGVFFSTDFRPSGSHHLWRLYVQEPHTANPD